MNKEYIIVLGSNGNIGKYFIDYLLKHLNLKKYDIVGCGRQEVSKNPLIKYCKIDITDNSNFDKLPTSNVKAVVDFAGLLPAYTDFIDSNSYIDVNIKGTLNVLEYCKKVKAERILYTHTWADLNGYLKNKKPLLAYSPRKPIFIGDHAVYVITKCAAVDLIEHYHQEYGINNYIFRLPNIYLYSDIKYYYVNGVKKPISYRYMIDKITNGEDIELWGNPSFGKDIVYVKDLCQMLYKAIFTSVKTGVYNVGTGIKTTMQEQIDGMIKIFAPKGKKINVIYKPECRSCDDFVMDISNAKEDLGYEPQYTYIKYLKDYKKEKKKAMEKEE